MIYCFIVTIVVSFLLNKKEREKEKQKKHKLRNGVITLFIITGMIYALYELSINRTGTGEYEFLYQVYVYFCGCMPHTSIRFNTVDIDYTYGMTFFSGILRPIMLVYKYLVGNGAFPEIYQRTISIGEILQSPVVISKGHTFNAFVLPFYYFYYDGGFIGVVLDSFIYGFICGKVFSDYQQTYQKKNLAKYLIIIIYISTSMIRFSPSIVYFAFSFFYIDFCFSKPHQRSSNG